MINLTINGVTYSYPQTGDKNWGTGATNWASAVTSGMLSKAGGSFPLTADVDFGSNFGLKALYLKTETANPPATGVLRLSNSDSIVWRNSGNSADIALKPDADGFLQYNSIDLVNISGSQTLTNKTMSGSSNTFSNIPYSAVVLTGDIVNADISASAAIVDTKLATIATAGKVSNSATTAASANTISAIVARDGSGDFSAGTITATLSGNATNVSGTVAIGNGGTGQTTANPAFNALSPLTTKGDLVSFSTVNARLPVGSNGQILTADSAQTLGIKWATPGTAVGSVSANITGVTDNTSISGTPSKVVFTTSQYDTNSAYSSGTFTVPVTGKYRVSALVAVNATFTSGQVVELYVYKNGSQVAFLPFRVLASAAVTEAVYISYTVSCTVSDTLEVYVDSTGTSPVLKNGGGAGSNFLTVELVGT